jgi:hypothetical protein
MKAVVVAVVLVLGMAFSVSWVRAQDVEAQSSFSLPGLKTGKNYTLKGSISGKAASPIPGACTGGNLGFANRCLGGHICVCTLVQGAKFSSTVIGKGTADVILTIDTSAGFGLPAVGQSPSSECFPFVAEIDLIAKNDSEALESTGAECTAPTNEQLSGAFAIATSNIFSSGYANFTAAINSNGSFKLNFKGAGTGQ